MSLGMIALKSKGASSYFDVGFDLVCDFDLRPNGYHVLNLLGDYKQWSILSANFPNLSLKGRDL